MMDIQDKSATPTLDEIFEYVRNPVFDKFCADLEEAYATTAQLSYSSCSMMPGWNIKFKKAGKGLCTIYPREMYFAVLVVVGRKEKDVIEAILPECSAEMQEIYQNTEEGNGQRWLMIELEDFGAVYEDVLRFIKIRREVR